MYALPQLRKFLIENSENTSKQVKVSVPPEERRKDAPHCFYVAQA